MIPFDFNEATTKLNAEITALNFDKKPQELYHPVRYFLDLGGKRMRPLLSLLSCYLFDNEYIKATKASLAIEIFHNFTLIHDDIMDNAPLRRGKPTVHEKWNRNIALLAGDITLIEAYEHLEYLPNEIRKDVVKRFNKTAFEVCEGQQFDMNFELREEVSIEEYIEMIRLKTAVLLGFSMYMGAKIGNATEIEANKMYEVALNIGLAFQIKDDYLDVYGDAKKFGKQVGGDILSDKKTFLLLSALKSKNNTDLKNIIGNKNTSSNEKINKVLAIYEKENIKHITEIEMKKYFDKAIEILKTVSADESKKSFISQYFNDLMTRET
ncbi:MAG: polyprenyl synthetase family protein [Bacteroidetes bacterium]|nr:MAG: polyprenyl synthetase family protein [Bacteroidota bacterium]